MVYEFKSEQYSGPIEKLLNDPTVSEVMVNGPKQVYIERKGKLVASEVMLGTSAVRTAIREGRTHTVDNIIMTSADYGMFTLEASLAQLVKSGKVSEETAIASLISVQP